MKVNRKDFLRSLESVLPGLAGREFLAQSSCFVFKGGDVATFNEEVLCRMPSSLDISFEGAVDSKPLLALLRNMGEEDLEVEQDDGQMVIHGKRRRCFGIRMEGDIQLPVDQIAYPVKWKKVVPDFLEAVQVVQKCAGKDKEYLLVTCVHLHPDWVEASDLLQVCRWRLKTGFPEPVLVSRDAVKHVPVMGPEEFSEGDSWVHFRRSDGMHLSCLRYPEEYPDFSEFFSVEGPLVGLPKCLVESLENASVFTKNAESDHVKVTLLAGEVRVSGEGDLGWYKDSAAVKYEGKTFSFLIPPGLLQDVVKDHRECVIGADRLRVDAGSYEYAAILNDPSEGGKGG